MAQKNKAESPFNLVMSYSNRAEHCELDRMYMKSLLTSSLWNKEIGFRPLLKHFLYCVLHPFSLKFRSPENWKMYFWYFLWLQKRSFYIIDEHDFFPWTIEMWYIQGSLLLKRWTAANKRNIRCSWLGSD